MTAEEAADRPFVNRWVDVDSVRTAKAKRLRNGMAVASSKELCAVADEVRWRTP